MVSFLPGLALMQTTVLESMRTLSYFRLDTLPCITHSHSLLVPMVSLSPLLLELVAVHSPLLSHIPTQKPIWIQSPLMIVVLLQLMWYSLMVFRFIKM